jgi:hypothetical protein
VRAYDMGRETAADHPDLGGSTGTDAVRRAIVGGFFANAARQESGGDYTSVLRGAPLKLHPNSVLWAAPPAWIVYHENVLTKHEMVLSATSVEEEWLVELAPHFYERAQVGLKRPRAEDVAASSGLHGPRVAFSGAASRSSEGGAAAGPAPGGGPRPRPAEPSRAEPAARAQFRGWL